MRALLRTNRSDDELAAALARAGLYVERVGSSKGRERAFADDVAVVDPRLLGGEPLPERPARPPADPLADRSLEELTYLRLGAVLDKLGEVRLPNLHGTVLAEVERALARLALERTGSVAGAAELLGVHRNTLARRLEELGLRPRAERPKAVKKPKPAAKRAAAKPKGKGAARKPRR